jgi:DNA-binding NarL/FixJ family response regulator
MPTVLIVDDHNLVRQALRSVLEKFEVVVCGEAVNGHEAIQKAQELHPDAVILDLSMPVMNGLDAARELRHLMPTVQLFMLTSYDSPQTRVAARNSGITEVFSKTEDLTPLIHQVCTSPPVKP